MKTCVICKTKIEEGLEVETEKGAVHSGPCLQLATKPDTLTESTDVDQIQMIL